jgi:hypothetical protein
MPRISQPPQERARQRAKWEILDRYISAGGGWIVSVPGSLPLRFEAEPGSILPEFLRSRGYIVQDSGLAERLLPKTEIIKLNARGDIASREGLAPAMVGIFHLDLPPINARSSR